MTVYLNCYFIEYYTIYLTQCYKSQFFTLQYVKNDLNVQTLARCYPNKGTITKKIVLHNPINSDLDLGHWKTTTLLLGVLQSSDDFDFDTAETLNNGHLGGQKKVSTFTNVPALNLISYLCSEFYGHDWLQTCRYKTRVLWRSFAKVREKSFFGFWNYWHFL